ncbi:hypothetical protein Taro_050770 [Colocasia esculenta]|uniref:Uncharacterized protein n=1 Tax=Colocasia esculenta TaxID=4460 RepID=A0A843XE84_COLES|nr:hypothetical protein [Colocasia esculenta]
MRGNKPLALQALMLAVVLLMVSNMLAGVSSARDPFVGLPLGGRRPVPRMESEQLDCCNKCDCNGDGTVCTCQDRLSRGCSVGCQDCHRDRGRGYYCRDTLDGCPESCDYDYDYDEPWRVGGRRRAAPAHEAPGHGQDAMHDQLAR